jgi:hypothetical protein
VTDLPSAVKAENVEENQALMDDDFSVAASDGAVGSEPPLRGVREIAGLSDAGRGWASPTLLRYQQRSPVACLMRYRQCVPGPDWALGPERHSAA